MKRSSLVFTPSRSAGGFFAVLQFAIVVSLALIAASFYATPARAELVTIDWVTVGDPGNAADTTGYGAVAEEFRIGKYEVTIGQYTDFLNAAAKSDPYSLYYAEGATNLNSAGISRAGSSGAYTYSVIGPSGVTPAGASSPGNRPMAFVRWFDAARFANWMHNGQGSGSTETGAYTLAGATSGTAPARNPGAQFYIPTEDQWYKAAYYKGGGTNEGYWDYATQSDSAPGNTIGSGANQANYYVANWAVTQSSSYSDSQNYLTDVGAFTGSPSAYGTFDQSGNVWELNDLTGAAGSSRGYRGGDWNSNSELSLSSSWRETGAPTIAGSGLGFRLASPVAVPEPSTWVMGLAGIACGAWQAWRRRNRNPRGRLLTGTVPSLALVAVFLAAVPARAVTIDWVTVGDAGNAADTTGYGAVAEEFQIGKYEVTIQQYTDFLNAAAKSDPYSLYNTSMASNLNIAGISRSGTSGGYSYSVIDNGGPSGNRPITYVSWFDAARFANWMHNGQGSGSTETGAYTLVGGQTSGTAPAKNLGAQFYIPTENEWYKAAYYKGSGTNAGYWDYATQSDTAPGNTIGSGANQANYYAGDYAVTQSASQSGSQNYLTDMGAFSGSVSAYGTFDQSGNVFEWNDLTGVAGSSRGLRGGIWSSEAFFLSSSGRIVTAPSDENDIVGFRLASPVAVPEPSTWVMGLAGIACAGWGAYRRRKRSPRSRALTAAVSCLALTVLFLTPAHAVTIDWVTVGDPGNAADTTGYGGVNYSYQIGKYEVTIQQYTDFLNAVAATDTYSLYNTSMASDLNIAGISRSGTSGGYSYSVIGSGARPIAYVSWFDAARFANWMQNGQGSGSTETGAYTLGGATSGNAVAKNSGATFYIPTENQWYKAAYYSPVLNSGSGGYYTYATQSNTAPGNTIGSGTNQANYRSSVSGTAVYSVTQSSSYSSSQNYLTDVGAFTNSASFYGTFDQSGNVWEWNDLDGTAGSSRGLRGGFWGDGSAFALSSSDGYAYDPSDGSNDIGFRLASPVAVPEPSTWVMGLAGLACGGWQMVRRRRAR